MFDHGREVGERFDVGINSCAVLVDFVKIVSMSLSQFRCTVYLSEP